MAEQIVNNTAVLDTPTPVIPKSEPFAVAFNQDDNLPTFMGQISKEHEPFIQYLSKNPKERDIELFMANNKAAIDKNVSIDKIPGAKQQYIDDETVALNIVGQEKAFEMKQKGKMGMAEAWGKLNKWEILPWLNGVATIDDIKVYKILTDIKANNPVSDSDKKIAQEYLNDMAEIQLRGFSFGGEMVYQGLRMPAYGIEFAAALGTMGGSAELTVAREVAEAGAKVGIKQLAKEVAIGTGKSLTKGALLTANPLMWHRTIKQYNADKINDSISITDKGQVIFKEATEKPFTAWMKAFGNTWVENSSEMAGAYMFKPVEGAIGRALPKGFGTAWTKAVEKTVGLKYADAIAKFGYDGVLEEMGEERVGDFMRTALDLDPIKGYSFDQFGTALFPDKEQLLTELGIISIYGGSSIAMAKLASKLVKPGENPEVILKDLANMSENQKQALLNKVDAVEVDQDTAKYTQGIESYGKMLEAIGVQPEVAKANLDILGSFIATTALKTGKSRYELLMELPDVQAMQNVPRGTSEEIQLFQNQIVETENRRKAIELQVKPINEQLDKLEELGKKNTQEYAKLFAEKESLDSQIKQLSAQESEFQRKIWAQQEIAKSKDEQQALFQNIVPEFYSRLQKTIEQKMPANAPVDQVRNIVKDMNKEELKWSGIDEFLAGKDKVNKQELLDYLKLNDLQIQEVTNSDIDSKKLRRKEIIKEIENSGDYSLVSNAGVYKLYDKNAVLIKESNYPENIKNLLNELISYRGINDATKFSQWQLPGGDNYREVLFTLPSSIDTKKLSEAYNKAKQDYENYIKNADKTYGESYLYPEDVKEKTRELNKIKNEAYMAMDRREILAEDSQYKSGHWEEKNVLAHIRLNDRIVDGKKVLFVEEIQSDWHQEGRKKGYVGESKKDKFESYKKELEKKYNNELSEIRNARITEQTPEVVADLKKLDELFKDYQDSGASSGVPDAPFKKTWHEFAVKKIIRMAAEQGYDSIAWTTGEQQAERYDLSKQVEKIDYRKNADNTYDIDGTAIGGQEINIAKNIDENTLADYVGKDVSVKIISDKGHDSAAGDGWKFLKGVELKVGGEGMKGFYDQIIPAAFKKFGKTNVEDMNISENIGNLVNVVQTGETGSKIIIAKGVTKESAEKFINEHPSTKDFKYTIDDEKLIVHSIKLTPETKQLALSQGFSLFQGKTTRTGMFDPKENMVTLLANADKSTFLHESAHFFLQYYLKNIPSELDAVFKFAGVQNKPLNELTAEEYKKLQEHFAYGFEAYIREGKAPNTQLADAFERFKQWLTDIYKNLEELSARAGFKVELSNDIRQFFDEMLAVPSDRQVKIDENMVMDKDIQLYQNALEKLDEIKAKRTELIKRFGKSARVELQAIDQSIKDLETVLNGIKRTSIVNAAEQAFMEEPLSEVIVNKIRITPDTKGMMDRYGVPSNIRTTKESAKTLDEWVTDLGIPEEQLLERLAKSGSKREFIDQYIARENTQLEAQGVTPESLKSELQSIGEKLATEYKKTTKVIGQVNEILREKKAPIAESVYAEVIRLGAVEDDFINTVKEKAINSYQAGSEWLNKVFIPISSGLEKINPALKQALRKFEFKILQVNHERNKIVVPFIEKYSKLSVEDARMLDFALKQSDITNINEIIDRNGMRKEYDSVVKLLESIYDDAVTVGLDIGYLTDYFPRKVADANKFKSYLRGTEQWTRIEEELNRKDANNEMSFEERAEYISTMLRGMGGNKTVLARPGYAKERKIIDLTPEMNRYYKDSSQAIVDYVRAMTEVIEAKKLFGKSEKDINTSIGKVVEDMINNGEIGFKDEKRVKELLLARFNSRGLNGIWSAYRDFTYLTLLGSPISAITQLEDIGVTMYKTGLFNTMKGLAESISGNTNISLADLGLETITQEFLDEKTGALAVKKLFKVTGFAFMDKLGKESFVNGVYNKYKELAIKGDKSFIDKLDTIFGEEAKQVVKDLKSGEISYNVKYLMFNELAEIQPLTLSEMPEYYVRGGNLRAFYSLKSFTIKRLDYLRRTIIDEISTNPVQGMQNLTRLVFSLMMMGATTDWIKNFLLGREQDPEEYLVNNIFKLFGFGKWVIYQARREGLMSAFSRQILPPFKLLDDLYKDAVNQRAIEDWDTWSNVPYIGKFYYWWFGRGSSTKNKKSKDKRF